MRIIVLACCLVFCLPASKSSPNEVIRAAVKVIEPLVSKNDKGEPVGFSIEVLKSVSREIGRPVSYIWVDSVEEQIKYVSDGKADLGIAAISITASREKTVDFSHPYLHCVQEATDTCRPKPVSPDLCFMPSTVFSEYISINDI